MMWVLIVVRVTIGNNFNFKYHLFNEYRPESDYFVVKLLARGIMENQSE